MPIPSTAADAAQVTEAIYAANANTIYMPPMPPKPPMLMPPMPPTATYATDYVLAADTPSMSVTDAADRLAFFMIMSSLGGLTPLQLSARLPYFIQTTFLTERRAFTQAAQ